MAVSFPPTLSNNPMLKGSPAAPKQRFGDGGRYAVWPIHTRFDAVEWFVADAEHPFSDMNHAEVIRQAETLELAMKGLGDDSPPPLAELAHVSGVYGWHPGDDA